MLMVHTHSLSSKELEHLNMNFVMWSDSTQAAAVMHAILRNVWLIAECRQCVGGKES